MPSPPSLPPPPLKIELTFAVVIAGDLESFDETAQTNYKTKLAELLEGIEPFDIELTVSVASLRVAATITPETTSAADASLGVLTSLAASTDDLSSALGVTVEEVAEMPSVITMESDGSLDNNQGLLLALSAGGAALVIVVLFICLCRRWRASRLREEVVQRFFGSRDIDAFDVELDVEELNFTSDFVSKDRSNGDIDSIIHSDFEGKDGRSPGGSKGSSAGKSKASSTSVSALWSSSNSGSQIRKSLADDSHSASRSVRKLRALSAMTQWQMTSTDIVWRDKIGNGSFGTVFRVQCGDEQQPFAAKRMDVSRSEVDQLVRRSNPDLHLNSTCLNHRCLTLLRSGRCARRCRTFSSVSSGHFARHRT